MKCDVCGSEQNLGNATMRDLKEAGIKVCDRCIDRDLLMENKKKLIIFVGNKTSSLSLENNNKVQRRPAKHGKLCNCCDCIKALIFQTRVKAFKEVLDFIESECF
jgi:ribosome-binding protein aMBF1 (putative translation factor)